LNLFFFFLIYEQLATNIYKRTPQENASRYLSSYLNTAPTNTSRRILHMSCQWTPTTQQPFHKCCGNDIRTCWTRMRVIDRIVAIHCRRTQFDKCIGEVLAMVNERGQRASV